MVNTPAIAHLVRENKTHRIVSEIQTELTSARTFAPRHPPKNASRWPTPSRNVSSVGHST